jgi:hypothetical protein
MDLQIVSPAHRQTLCLTYPATNLCPLLGNRAGEGPGYPDDFEWAIWQTAPVSKTHKDAHYGAFMVVAKPYTAWQRVAASEAGRTDPQSPADPMWSPHMVAKAMQK